VDISRREHPLNADPAEQQRLLDLADQDGRLAQLAHRRRTLPELGEIEQLTGRLTVLRDRVVAGETETGDIAREVAKAERDVEQVRERSSRDHQRLDSGAITSAKELESLQHEIGSLARRQSELEEIELEILERQESAEGALAQTRQEAGEVETQLNDAVERRDQAFADIDKDSAYVSEGRAALAAGLSAELLALYDKIRAKQGDPAAAALSRGQCGACRMELNSTELVEVRAAPPDLVLRHEDCGAILVRTPESGL
jgi:predicted  nucleic acid-binding Zn-ribbon protein